MVPLTDVCPSVGAVIPIVYPVKLVCNEIVTGSESTLVVKQAPEVTAATNMFPEANVSPETDQPPLATVAVPSDTRLGFVLYKVTMVPSASVEDPLIVTGFVLHPVEVIVGLVAVWETDTVFVEVAEHAPLSVLLPLIDIAPCIAVIC